ncbi:MAG: radical SAM protein [Clostridia bacterium]|nr:radical SAM protein [Clostridia bacterium]
MCHNFNIVNLHITEKCNYNCVYCFSKFKKESELDLDGWKKVVDNCASYFLKNGSVNPRINLSGGEPFTCSFIFELIDYIAGKGIEVSVITNGSLLSEEKIQRLKGKVSMIGLSIDSLNHETNVEIGRDTNGRTLDFTQFQKIFAIIKGCGIKLKVNTVVSKLNINEDLSTLYEEVTFDRIKLLQMRVNSGVNERASSLQISEREFKEYSLKYPDYKKVVESDGDLDGTYIIVSPGGKLISNKGNKHNYVGSLLEEPLEKLIETVSPNYEGFKKRYA